ncbi:hypothetical protein BLNAU_3453 [Blattamonas nauphoetae]|uniref:Uncharacterized protein n=1 Tax=Blattamonas nauphoetae TaxID=2049346 RepID=A0ABQ9YD77_9EUKA|nr:hypothetical protein BLNAU_3453 [Blattamonas nauphoetae]
MTVSFQDQSTIYCSLVTLVKAEYRFNNALQDRAAQFLKGLEPSLGERDLATKLVTELVPSSDGSISGFIDSILTLLSSLHSTVAASALSLLHQTTRAASPAIQSRLVESDLIPKVLSTVRPHTLPIAENEEIIAHLLIIIASPASLIGISLINPVKKFNHRDMIFQKVVLPSTQIVTYLISNRHILTEDLFYSFMSLLSTFLRICPFHRPTLEYVLASPIAMAYSSCLSFAEHNFRLWMNLDSINQSLQEWRSYNSEVIQSAKRMMQASFSEGFEDTLEQMMNHDRNGKYGNDVVYDCNSISRLLGSNVEFTE